MRNDCSEFTGSWYLLPGRFSPLHAGHIKLIRTALKQYGKVEIGIRNTPIGEKNPFTIEQRVDMIKKEFQKEIEEDVISTFSLTRTRLITIRRSILVNAYNGFI